MFAIYFGAALSLFCYGECMRYEPTWSSLDQRPLPSWYDEAKFGIFLHWGVFSVPSWGSLHSGSSGEWFWWNWQGAKVESYIDFMTQNYPPDWTYADFASQYMAELFDPNQWAEIFQASGAKYVVLTSKHHEGFTNWPSKRSWNWNSMDTGPHRDLVGDLATAIRNSTDIHFGLYHSLFEWFNPIYLHDKSGAFKAQDFVQEKTMPELYELVNMYHPEVIWSDGDWEASDTYWNSTNFLAWLYNDSPVKDMVVTNDRWGIGTHCKHGGYFSCDDRYNPGKLQNHKWENAMTIDRWSWGYRRNGLLQDYLNITELLEQLVTTVSCGGNLLMNVGPTHDGRILPIFEERLRQMGSWLQVNGEAIYGSLPWQHQNDSVTPGVWYTMKKADSKVSVYAIVLRPPMGDFLVLGSVTPTPGTTVSLLGYQGDPFTWKQRSQGGITVMVPQIQPSTLPTPWAWVLKIQAP